MLLDGASPVNAACLDPVKTSHSPTACQGDEGDARSAWPRVRVAGSYGAEMFHGMHRLRAIVATR